MLKQMTDRVVSLEPKSNTGNGGGLPKGGGHWSAAEASQSSISLMPVLS